MLNINSFKNYLKSNKIKISNDNIEKIFNFFDEKKDIFFINEDIKDFHSKNKFLTKEEKKRQQIKDTLYAFEQIKKSVPKDIAIKMNNVNIDFTKDNILPDINENEAKKLNGKVLPIRLKKNIINRNKEHHTNIPDEIINALLATALYSPDDIYSAKGKGYFQFIRFLSPKNHSLVLLDIKTTKDGFYDIVHYYFVDDRNKRRTTKNEQKM